MADTPTEKPTARRLHKAWRRGQFPRTRDAATACSFGVAAAALPALASEVRRAFDGNVASAVRAISADDFADPGTALREAAKNALLSLAPWLAALCALVLVAGMLQSRFFFGAGALGRGFSSRRASFSFVEAAKFLTRASVAFVAVYSVIDDAVPSLFRTGAVPIARSFEFVSSLVSRLGVRLAAAFALVAVLDYLVERARHLRALRMTREELRREEREDEGDPQLRRGRLRLAKEEAHG